MCTLCFSWGFFCAFGNVFSPQFHHPNCWFLPFRAFSWVRRFLSWLKIKLFLVLQSGCLIFDFQFEYHVWSFYTCRFRPVSDLHIHLCRTRCLQELQNIETSLFFSNQYRIIIANRGLPHKIGLNPFLFKPLIQINQRHGLMNHAFIS